MLLSVAFALCTLNAQLKAETIDKSQFRGVRPSVEVPAGKERVKLLPATGAYEAARWRRLGQLDENGQIDPDGYSHALKQIKGLVSERSRFGPTENVWSEVGPHNVTGRTRSLLIHPTESNRMWMGAVSGGVWYSSDSGTNWAPINDKLPNLNITHLAFAPGNPNTMFAATGEGYFNGDAKSGNGLYKSTDTGNTWAVLPSTAGFGNINKVVLSPTNANLMLIGTQSGGIRRTTDGGSTWTNPIPAQIGYGATFHPTDGNQAIATVLDYDFSGRGYFTKAFRTTDAGATWTACTGLDFTGSGSRIEVAYAPSNPTIVYAHTGFNGGKVYKSTDSGATFTLVTTSGVTNASWYNNSIWVDPTDPNFVIATGLNINRSINGGATFSNIGNGYLQTETPHPDMHLGVAHPAYDGTTNLQFFVCTDGGIHKADNIRTVTDTTGWTRLTRNASTMQFYGAAGNGTTGVLFGGSQDNGSIRIDLGSTVSTNPFVFGGDGGFSAVSHVDSNYLYGEYINLQIFRSSNGGNSAGYITSGLNRSGANFIAPLVLDPNDDNYLYGGASNLSRSANAKAATPTWSSIYNFGSTISAITVAKGNSNLIYVGGNDGRVFKSVNGQAVTPTFTAIDNNGASNPFPSRYIHRIAVDPSNNNTVYVALGGFSSGNIYKSTNGGTTWTALSGLPSAPVHGICVNPANSNELWAGTEVGIIRSLNGGTSWTAPADGPLNVAVDEVVYLHNSSKVLAATHGRGLWIYGPVSLSAFTGPANLLAGAVGTFNVTFDLPAGSSGRVVNLTSSNPALLPVPASVTVPARGTTASFTATAGGSASSASVTLTASTSDGLSQTHVVGIGPIGLDRVEVTPTTPIGGRSGTAARVYLNGPAPTGGIVVNLTTSNAAVLTVPATVTIPAGQTNRAVTVTTATLSTRSPAWVKATYNAVAKQKNFNIEVPLPTALTITPFSFTGGLLGTVVTGKIDLIVPAGPGGLTVALASSDSAITVPATVTFPAGASTVNFPITHSAVTSSRDFGIKVTAGFQEKRGYGRVVAPQISSAIVSPSTVKGGSGTAVSIQVNLSGPAPSGGLRVYLYSSLGSAASMPASILIPAGSTFGTATVTHLAVTSSKVVTLTASNSSYGKRTATLTINP